MPSWPVDTPSDAAEWRQALLDWHDWAVALYLILAEENVFMQYQVWYMTYLGGVPCTFDLNSSIAGVGATKPHRSIFDKILGRKESHSLLGQSTNPNCDSPSVEQWYPNLGQYLGAPLGAYVQSGNTYTREFENASVYLDLANPEASTVTFHS